MFKDFELPFVPTLVVGFVVLLFAVSVISDIQTAINAPPPSNSVWLRDGNGDIYRATPRNPLWEPVP